MTQPNLSDFEYNEDEEEAEEPDENEYEVDEEAGEDEGEDVLEPAQRATEVDTRTSVEPSRPAAIATAADEAQSIESSVMQQPSVSAKRKRRKKVYTICLTNCQYDVVRNSAKNFGLVEVEEEEEWSIFWTDLSVTLERVCAMKAYQKINHFPGMSEICRKDGLGRNLSRMQKLFPKEFNIAPKTWILPSDWSDLQAFARTKRNKTYILKPESSCQGKGIWCTRNVKDIKPGEHQVCQLYLTRPFLIDGYKFDLRIYVLITSCDPLRIFVFKEGLARFTTVKYKDPCGDNMGNVYMHLTNYAVQKGSKEFVRNDEEGGTKRRLTTINRWLESNGYDLQKIWADIDDAIIKTVLSAHSVLKHNYRTCFPTHMRGSACFEILGFDVILDRRMKPFVLEVNHSPSFATDSRLDREIKEALITDTFGLINLGAVDRRKILEEERRRVRDRLTQRNNKKESRVLGVYGCVCLCVLVSICMGLSNSSSPVRIRSGRRPNSPSHRSATSCSTWAIIGASTRARTRTRDTSPTWPRRPVCTRRPRPPRPEPSARSSSARS
ncbi:hypothetical protein BOX15_Mlig027012g1 [Macrostomum lignano]|uniref:Tubulin--tyrosine ligase-like protein 9 n=1 Tax=Macrostomum lignano TaxID=282301 RepID=A0A267G608_9PLAT|nr:hypothetical protein BOX15_Mlig027012g1 [Macrostomum lignano]